MGALTNLLRIPVPAIAYFGIYLAIRDIDGQIFVSFLLRRRPTYYLCINDRDYTLTLGYYEFREAEGH